MKSVEANSRFMLICLAIALGFLIFALVRPDFIFFIIPGRPAPTHLAATSWSMFAAVLMLLLGITIGRVILHDHKSDGFNSWRFWAVLVVAALGVGLYIATIVASDVSIKAHINEVCKDTPTSIQQITPLDFRGQYCYNVKNNTN